jgi:hypothetical protein
LPSRLTNGGYEQLLSSASNELAAYFEASLMAIGRPEVAAITSRAIKALRLRGPLSVDAIDKAMDRDDEQRDATLEECDAAYLASAGDLAGPLFAFIKKNREMVSLTP